MLIVAPLSLPRTCPPCLAIPILFHFKSQDFRYVYKHLVTNIITESSHNNVMQKYKNHLTHSLQTYDQQTLSSTTTTTTTHLTSSALLITDNPRTSVTASEHNERVAGNSSCIIMHTRLTCLARPAMIGS